MSSEEPQDRLKMLETELKGKTLQIYWFMIGKAAPIGVREVQRALKFSSPSIAFHHLEKLKTLGVVDKDEHGRYFLCEKVDVGVLQAFSRLGTVMLPRFIFYAIFFTTLLILYLIQFYESLNLFALSFAVSGSAVSWYETVRAWRKKPF